MVTERDMIEYLASTTQEQCREAGELFLSLADAPRDELWRANFRKRLAAMPEPNADFAKALEQGRERVARRDAKLWERGWHPLQMERELRARGYSGLLNQDPEPYIGVIGEYWERNGSPDPRIGEPGREALGAVHPRS